MDVETVLKGSQDTKKCPGPVKTIWSVVKRLTLRMNAFFT